MKAPVVAFLLLLSATNAFIIPPVLSSALTSSRPASPLTMSASGGFFQRLVSSVIGAPPPPPPSFQDKAPSWDELKKILYDSQTEEERALLSLRETGRGPTDPKAAIRLFDAPEGYQPRVTLFRDHAGWCPYCEKVWLMLEEKRIPYQVSKVNMRCYGSKPMSFLKMVPSGMLPAAIIDGQLVTESNDIMQVLEDRFPDNKALLPSNNSPHAKDLPQLLRLERELFGSWLRWLTGPTQMDASLRASYEKTIGRVEQELAARGGPYFLGEEFSIVDCIFAPFLERMAASLAYYKAFILRGPKSAYPAITRWFEAMETRPTYKFIKSDWYTHVHDLPPQIGDCLMIPEAEAIAAEVDGTDGKSWELPLKDGFEPVIPHEPERAKREAAAQLIHNHEAVARFAGRGLGRPGMPPVSAPLADPNASSNDEYLPLIDSALRSVALALLKGTEAIQPSPGLPPNEIAMALGYLRDRVGVPRDLTYEAARQLRAHLNYVNNEVKRSTLA